MDEFKLYMMKDKGWSSDHYDKILFEFNRFITLYHEDDNISPNGAVDTFWHEFLLETRIYHEYCFDKFGHYVHHSVLRSQDNNWKHRYQQTLTKYKNKYGDIDNEFWVTVDDDNSSKVSSSNVSPSNVSPSNVSPSNVSPSKVDLNSFDMNEIDLMKNLVGQPHFPVTVKGLTGRTYIIQTCDNMTIYQLKHLIDGLGNMARLIFDRKELDNKKTIKDYNITSDSIIHLVLKLC